MGQVTHDQAKLMLHLYEMRREPLLRQARAWFFNKFHPSTPEDLMKLCPPGSKENAYMRMVISYWEMVANIVSRGLIDEEFFFENSGEQWVVWNRVKPIAAAWRARLKNPHAWEKLEEHCTKFEAWRERRAPGSNEAMRQMMAQMQPIRPAARTKKSPKRARG